MSTRAKISRMNYFLDDASDLEEEQLNINLSGPSNSPQKTKTAKGLWHSSNVELGNSLVNLKASKTRTSTRTTKVEKHKNKSNGKYHKSKSSRKSNIRQLLMNRLKMYSQAEQISRETGETKNARLLNRDVQILNALIAHHDAGNIVDLDNIPPEIKSISHDSKLGSLQLGVTFKESAEVALIPYATQLDTTSTSETDSVASIEKILGILRLRRDQYKISVVQNKGVGNVPRALEHLNIVKMFDSVIRHLELGEKVDLNDLPGPPECPICHINSVDENREVEKQCITINNSESSVEEQIISHSTILQALQSRFRAYEVLKMEAKKEHNVGEALRIDRIIKIYREAIRLHRLRKPFPIDDLPSPPGFAPIHNLKSTLTPNKPTKFSNIN